MLVWPADIGENLTSAKSAIILIFGIIENEWDTLAIILSIQRRPLPEKAVVASSEVIKCRIN